MAQRWSGDFSEVALRVRNASRVFLCLGFDGTLVPIEDRPEDVHLAERVRDLVRRLAADGRTTVAIFSGREGGELARMVGLPDLIYVGNHGLEMNGPGVRFLEPTGAQFGAALQEIRALLQQRLEKIPGAIVENKGLSVALHFRTVPADRLEEFRSIVHSVLGNAAHPFVLREGRMVYELRPRAYWNKGHALAWLRDRFDEPDVLTIYVGDDNTDEDAFTAVADAVTIRVGDAAGSAALYAVDGPKDVAEFMHWLHEQLVQPRTA